MRRCNRIGVADDRLQHVGGRHHPFETAIFVEHQRQPAGVCFQAFERVERRHRIRHHHGLAQCRGDRQFLAVEDAVEDVLGLHHTNHVVDPPVAHDEARMRRRFQRLHNVLRRVRPVDPGDIGARRHDGAHRLVRKAQHPFDHVALAALQHAGFGPLGQDRLEFLLRHRLLRRGM